MTYEEAEKELDKIVKKMEEGSLTLNEATLLYERGAELIEFCSKELEKSKGKITAIRNKIEENLN